MNRRPHRPRPSSPVGSRHRRQGRSASAMGPTVHPADAARRGNPCQRLRAAHPALASALGRHQRRGGPPGARRRSRPAPTPAVRNAGGHHCRATRRGVAVAGAGSTIGGFARARRCAGWRERPTESSLATPTRHSLVPAARVAPTTKATSRQHRARHDQGRSPSRSGVHRLGHVPSAGRTVAVWPLRGGRCLPRPASGQGSAAWRR